MYRSRSRDDEGEFLHRFRQSCNADLVERHVETHRLELVWGDRDQRIGLFVMADDAERGPGQSLDLNLERARLMQLVEDLDRVAVADAAVGQPDVERIAVVQHVDLERRALAAAPSA